MNHATPFRRFLLAAALLCGAARAQEPAAGPRAFIPAAEMPDPLSYLPPPPAEGSPEKARDLERNEWGRKMRADPARAALAVRDAVYTWENFWDMMSPAYGRPISDAETPALCAMLRYGVESAHQGAKGAKKRWNRVRPFAELGEPSLLPDDEHFLVDNGSYPSGHAVNGWAGALLLSEVRPAAAGALRARGLEIG